MIGNFWRARATVSGRRVFETADTLWGACCEYFQWIEDNPVMVSEKTKDSGIPVLIRLPKPHAMTITGLCIYLGVTTGAWRKHRDEPKLSAVCKCAQDIIYQQKFAGAAAGLLNPLIVAREIGLTEKSEHEVTGVVATAALDPAEYARIREEMLKDDDC